MGFSMAWDLEKADRLAASIVHMEQTIEFMNTAEKLPLNI